MRQDEIQRKRDTAVKAAQLQSRATPRPQFQPVVNPESSRSSRRVASSAPSSQIPEAAGVRRGDSEGIINEEANGEANGEEPYYPNDDADGALEALVRAKDVDVKGKGKGEPKTSM
ncbi:hypothetical protein EYR38_010562 [Pleurotus pulmonarius]|nr:hypothetical protein EYR38_010562 [Pleurotus pulmonarius]